jgi:uncharacterized flavoprotein (TIGR03862 family)
LKQVAIIGAGPAGLMAAEVIAAAGHQVDLYDAMPSVGRKLLLAGIGGLNITHAESFERFITRYATSSTNDAPQVMSWLQAFGPEQLRAWVHALGIDTFVGSSQRVFPAEMKAAPLLRAWLHSLRSQGVRFHARHRWQGFGDTGKLLMAAPDGQIELQPDATVLALGGGSWRKLGSDGAWLPWLRARSVRVHDLQPANCGFDVVTPWSTLLREKFAGQPLKNVALHLSASPDRIGFSRQGEFVITETGVEGSLVYAASRLIRQAIENNGQATVSLDLLPALRAERVLAEVSHPRGSKSLSAHLKSRLNLQGVKMGLLNELLTKEQMHQPAALAAAIKALPLHLARPRPLDEAISSAGGVALESLTADLMLRELPGIFCAGEMLDWEAPTGGYLLTATWASGRVAGHGVNTWLTEKP